MLHHTPSPVTPPPPGLICDWPSTPPPLSCPSYLTNLCMYSCKSCHGVYTSDISQSSNTRLSSMATWSKYWRPDSELIKQRYNNVYGHLIVWNREEWLIMVEDIYQDWKINIGTKRVWYLKKTVEIRKHSTSLNKSQFYPSHVYNNLLVAKAKTSIYTVVKNLATPSLKQPECSATQGCHSTIGVEKDTRLLSRRPLPPTRYIAFIGLDIRTLLTYANNIIIY